MLLGVVEHSGADAVFAVSAMQHIYIDASLAAAPKGLVIGEVSESYRLITQLCVHRHHCSSARQTEYLGVWPTCACESERHVLDFLGHSQSSEIRMNDETGGGDILLVASSLDITESGEPVATESYHSLCLLHLGGEVFVGALCNTSAAHLGGISDSL